jgi:hypothetical protein
VLYLSSFFRIVSTIRLSVKILRYGYNLSIGTIHLFFSIAIKQKN